MTDLPDETLADAERSRDPDGSFSRAFPANVGSAGCYVSLARELLPAPQMMTRPV
jgi:hypothetical protein